MDSTMVESANPSGQHKWLNGGPIGPSAATVEMQSNAKPSNGNTGADTAAPDGDVKLMDLDDFLHGMGVHVNGGGQTPTANDDDDVDDDDDSQGCPINGQSTAIPELMTALGVSGHQPPPNQQSMYDNGMTQLDDQVDDRMAGSGGGNGGHNYMPELKPHPILRKSRKQVTPDEHKDERYWSKRAKNNFAAKRSRETRRQRENQIVLRANHLERENQTLRRCLKRLEDENRELRRLFNRC